MSTDVDALELITTAGGIRSFCGSVGNILAVDTESDHFLSYRPQICLIQVATEERCGLIDPFEVNERDLEPLFAQLYDPSIEKLFHAGQNDFLEFHRDYGIEVRNVFDTRVAGRFLGYRKTNLDWMLEEHLGIMQGPNMQKFDWQTRPLPERAIEYAARDVVHLFELRERLQEELSATGWEEAFTQTCAKLAATSRFEEKPFDEEGWRRVKGVEKLDGEGRAVARALYLWRHRRCLEVNKAAFTILADHDLVRLARQRPDTLTALQRHGSAKKLRASEVSQVLEVMQRAKEEEHPPKRRGPDDRGARLSCEEEERFKRMRKWRNQAATTYQIPSEYIATNQALQRVAANPPATMGDLTTRAALMPWQKELFGAELLAIAQT